MTLTAMAFNKELALSVLRRNEVLFSEKLNPEEILPHLPSMSEMSKQEIKCEQRNFGEKRASHLLLRRIRQQDKCLVEFIKTLRHPDILLSDLADLLDPKRLLLDTGQNEVIPSFPKKPFTKSPEKYSGSTPIRHLPLYVMDVLQDKLDYAEKWRDLASYRGYTIEDVQKLQSTTKSCTKQIIEDWHDADVDSLFKALQAIGRKDIITDLEELIGYRSLFSDEHFIDLHAGQSVNHDVKGSQATLRSVSKSVADLDTDDFLPSLTNSSAPCHDKDLTKQNSVLYSPENNWNRQQKTPNVNDSAVRSMEPYSIENNALQPNNNKKDVFEKESEGVDCTSCHTVTESEGVDCTSSHTDIENKENNCTIEKNNNTHFPEKKFKDKVIDMLPSNPYLFGAGVIGSLVVGMMVFNKSFY